MKNITLIGMPSVGKSTVGVVLAKLTGRKFIDTDLILQESGERLPVLIERLGSQSFIELESKTLASISVQNSVIATGGSAVYGAEGMERLKAVSTVVYLRAPVSELKKRLGDFSQRGVVSINARTIDELYTERAPLYERYADVIIDETGTLADTVKAIIEAMHE